MEFCGEGVVHACVLTSLHGYMHAYAHTHIGFNAGMPASLPDRLTRRMLCRLCSPSTGPQFGILVNPFWPQYNPHAKQGPTFQIPLKKVVGARAVGAP